MKIKEKSEISLNIKHLWKKPKKLFNMLFKIRMINYYISLKIITFKKNKIMNQTVSN